MTVKFPRACLLLAASFLLIVACEGEGPTVIPDPTVQPSQVSSQALQASELDERTRRFYEARNWKPAWTGKTGAQMQAAINDLGRHGIDPSRLAVLPTADDPVGREIALTKAALTYGDTLAHGLIDPAKVFEIFALERNDLDVDASLNEALDRRNLTAWLKSLPPADEEYRALSAAYLEYLTLAQKPQPPAVAEGKAVKPGQSDPRIPQIALMLQTAGYFEPPPDIQDEVYASALVEAVKAFQNQQGVNADGVLGAETIALLNAGPMDRARQIALNLEARRWLKRDAPATRIDVNTAAAVLRYYRDGELADSRRTVAGKADTTTPNLSGAFSQLVVNPPWNVPQGIAEKEILPKGPGYLAANDMYVQDGRVIQRPGPKASLGLVKFDMQNRYAIYLHDTPSKAAFQANERHRSHGCVRVDDAVGFARLIAGERGKEADFDARLSAGKTAVVTLGDPVPVRLFYHTAFLDESGGIAFRPDVYGWDEKLALALGMPAPIKREVAPVSGGDMGP